MGLRLHYIQHVEFEGLGSIKIWTQKNNCKVTSTKVYKNHTFPKTEDFDLLIVLGGPMSVNDTKDYPWIKEESEFIKSAINGSKKIIGICLGAQLIAKVLGTDIKKNIEKEIGFFPVAIDNTKHNLLKNIPELLTAFHWHGETFDTPLNAVSFTRSKACENQGFIYKNNIIALQFHLETQIENIQNLIENCSDELTHGKYIQSKRDMLFGNHDLEEMNDTMHTLLDNLTKK